MRSNRIKTSIWLSKALALLSFLGVSGISGALAEPVPGSRISMDKPAGFEKASNFVGFQKAASGASIMVSEIPGPYKQVTAGFNEAGLASRGMKLVSKTPQPVGNLEGMLVEVSQSANGTEFHKWMLAFGDASSCILVTSCHPAELDKELSEPLRKAVLSSQFNSSAPLPSAQNDLNFTVSPQGGFKLAGRIQNVLIFNKQGQLPKAPAPRAAGFVAGQAFNDLAIDDPAQYSRRRLRQTAGMSNFEILSEKDIEIAGLKGRELLAQADDQKIKEKSFIYHLMLFGKGSYFIMQGICPATERSQNEEAFRSLSKSFKLRAK